MARPARRLVGILTDWLVASLIAAAFLAPLGRSIGPLLVLLAEQVLLVSTAGCSLGHRLAGLRVERLDGGPPGLGRSALRSMLLCLAVPPLIWDRDQRGLHDKAAGTVIVRS
ncbi:MAG TPA: RDD family protein [Kineosporiaceae bacterium]